MISKSKGFLFHFRKLKVDLHLKTGALFIICVYIFLYIFVNIHEYIFSVVLSFCSFSLSSSFLFVSFSLFSFIFYNYPPHIWLLKSIVTLIFLGGGGKKFFYQEENTFRSTYYVMCQHYCSVNVNNDNDNNITNNSI